jgi:rubredoxin
LWLESALNGVTGKERVFGMSEFRTYMCVICGFIYDEEKGLPEEGIEPGTRWQDIPLNWVCPECGASKDDFEMVEV